MIIILVCLILFILSIILDFVYKKNWSKGLSVNIDIGPSYLSEGTIGELIETVTNDKNMPLSNLNVRFNISSKLEFFDIINASNTDKYYRDDIFSIAGNEIITRKLKFTATNRGVYYIDHTYIVTNGIFFSKVFTKKLPNKPKRIYVYPIPLKAFEIPVSVNYDVDNFINSRSLYSDPFLVSGLREYQSYDTMNAINWKSTAKNNKLMVNEYDTISSLNIDVIFNAQLRNFGLEKLGEYGIKAAMTIVYKIYKMGIPVSFESNAQDIDEDTNIKVKTQNKYGNMRLINESLSKINFKNIYENFMETMKRYEVKDKRKLIIISSDLDNELLEEYKKIKKIKNQNIMFVVPVEKDDDMCKKYKNSGIVFWEVL